MFPSILNQSKKRLSSGKATPSLYKKQLNNTAILINDFVNEQQLKIQNKNEIDSSEGKDMGVLKVDDKKISQKLKIQASKESQRRKSSTIALRNQSVQSQGQISAKNTSANTKQPKEQQNIKIQKYLMKIKTIQFSAEEDLQYFQDILIEYDEDLNRQKLIMKRLKEQERKRQEELIHKQEILYNYFQKLQIMQSLIAKILLFKFPLLIALYYLQFIQILKAKLELEFQLIQERNKLQAILEGKMSAYLKQKIQDLQDKIDDLYKVNKDHVNRQRFLNKKIDQLNATLEEKQQQFKARLEEQRKKQDEFILSTTQHNLSLSELESQNKSWKLAYEKILDNKQKEIHLDAEQRVEESIRKMNEIKLKCNEYQSMYLNLLFEIKLLKKDLEIKDTRIIALKEEILDFQIGDQNIDVRLQEYKTKLNEGYQRQLHYKAQISDLQVEIEILNSQLQDKNRRDVRKQELENQKLHGAVNIIAQEKIQMEADILKLKNQNQRLLNSLAELEIVIQKFDQDQERFQRQNLKEWIEELKKQVLWDKQL